MSGSMSINQSVIKFPREKYFNSIEVVVIEYYTYCKNKENGNCSYLKIIESSSGSGGYQQQHLCQCMMTP